MLLGQAERDLLDVVTPLLRLKLKRHLKELTGF
jgi:hypothetical protein